MFLFSTLNPFNVTSNSSNYRQASISREAFKSRILPPNLSSRCELPPLHIPIPFKMRRNVWFDAGIHRKSGCQAPVH